MSLKAYLNADWVDFLVDRRSMSRYCTFLGWVWWHGEVRSNQLFLDGVQKPNSKPWHMRFVSYCG